jgi:hypothetical protein
MLNDGNVFTDIPHCVSASQDGPSSDDRLGQMSTWQILRKNGAGPVSDGDLVYIRYTNQATNSSEGAYLQTQSHLPLPIGGLGCQGNKQCVSTDHSKSKNGLAALWQILRKHGSGTVSRGDEVYLRNLGGDGNLYLDVRGENCNQNDRCISAADSPARDGDADSLSTFTGTWHLFNPMYEKSCVAYVHKSFVPTFPIEVVGVTASHVSEVSFVAGILEGSSVNGPTLTTQIFRKGGVLDVHYIVAVDKAPGVNAYRNLAVEITITLKAGKVYVAATR